MDGKKLKILIIDDDNIMRNVYAEVFKEDDFEVLEANDGLEGLDKAIKTVPDIIFTGIIMPKMDGFALKDALSKNVATVNIPVVMSSHMGREDDRKKAVRMGVKGFFIQGMITPKEVVEKVRALFDSEEYRIKFSGVEMDAPKLAHEFHLAPDFKCQACQRDMVLAIKRAGNGTGEFSARFICPNCEK